MWLCTQLGLLIRSHLMFVLPFGQRPAVCLGSHRSPRLPIVRKEAGTFCIRARCREDLDQLAQAAGTGTPIASYAGSDYPWRILRPAADLPRLMSALTASIDYSNFKSAIAATPTQRPKLSAYHDIPHLMVE